MMTDIASIALLMSYFINHNAIEIDQPLSLHDSLSYLPVLLHAGGWHIPDGRHLVFSRCRNPCFIVLKQRSLRKQEQNHEHKSCTNSSARTLEADDPFFSVEIYECLQAKREDGSSKHMSHHLLTLSFPLLQLSSFHWSRLVKCKPRHDLLLNVSDRLPRSRAVNGIIHSSQTLNFQACLIQALNLHVSSCILHDLLDLPWTCCLIYPCLKVHKASKLPCEAVFCEGNTGNIRKSQSPLRSKSSSQNVLFSFAFSLVTRLLFEPSLEGVQQTFQPCWL